MALVEPPTVAVTSTTPVPGGLVAVQLVVLAQLTPLAGALPKLMDVPFVDGSKLVPVTVTRVPPAAGPLVGLTPVTVGNEADFCSVLTETSSKSLVPTASFHSWRR